MTDWPHAPVHRLDDAGTYMVTAGTYLKKHHLCAAERLDLVQDTLFATAREFLWDLQAWAIMSNHYHFVAISPQNPQSLRQFISKLHGQTARRLNQLDNCPGRKVWYQFFDSRITYQRSYLARLKYVHENPARHGVVSAARNYPWCSAAWFEREADPAFWKTVMSFKVDRVNVIDSFDPVKPDE